MMMEINIFKNICIHVVFALTILFSSFESKVTRCFEDSDCVVYDVCIHYSCYEIRRYEEKCFFDKECDQSRNLTCKNNECTCRDQLQWIWSISQCKPPGYCQIEQDCPGSDYKCNNTTFKCQKMNPIIKPPKKLRRSGTNPNAGSLGPSPAAYTLAAVAAIFLLFMIFTLYRMS